MGSLAQYKNNICCHHHFSLPTQQNCLLKFKLPSYGFSLSALKCTNLTKANTRNNCFSRSWQEKTICRTPWILRILRTSLWLLWLSLPPPCCPPSYTRTILYC